MLENLFPLGAETFGDGRWELHAELFVLVTMDLREMSKAAERAVFLAESLEAPLRAPMQLWHLYEAADMSAALCYA